MIVEAIKIDHEACWGCKTCEVACKQENRATDGVKLIAVLEKGPEIVAGKLNFVFHVNVCRHCDEPPCVDACPESAISKRSDRIVIMDDDLCTGCQACIETCPYEAIDFDPHKGIAQKCNLCHHRIENGLIPACADNVCPAHCIHFSCIDATSS
ncbi:MAG: 4Fe-4S binding protein [Deltaproteobacteria bacterium]|jgi:Fe-S-cluster-containing dehydrogenase component|nr:4Fe-4S binding protein [Deltaproteobacteria bacterium]MBW2517790.1 4Fe-4S binding protein [Deltaproteobacteria bacterium]